LLFPFQLLRSLLSIPSRCPLLSLYFFLHCLAPLLLTLFPYTTLFRSNSEAVAELALALGLAAARRVGELDRLLRAGAKIERLKRSEEHTSELQSLRQLVCRLLLEKKKTVA